MCETGFWARWTFGLIQVELILYYSLCLTYHLITIVFLQTESFKKIHLDIVINLQTQVLHLELNLNFIFL